MFQQSIPRLLPDSDIATYHWPFILIEHRLWPILIKGCKLLRVDNEKRFSGICDSQTSPGKIKIKVLPIDQLCWIKFRVPEMTEGSSLQNFSFPSFSNRSNSSRHESSSEPNSEATRKDPDPKKIPGSSFALLNQCAKFKPKILTLST